MTAQSISGKNIVVVIPCYNQGETVALCADYLLSCGIKPTTILVVDDHSDHGKGARSHHSIHVKIEKASGGKGRSSTRNQGIRSALKLGADFIIFMDGDTIPADNDFVGDHVKALMAGPAGRIVFGMRRHIPRPTDFKAFLRGLPMYHSETCTLPPSDYLTANMDNMFSKRTLTDQDLRIVSGTVAAYQSAQNFDEKCDLITSGMVTWSCNFSLDKEAAHLLNEKMKSAYGVDGWFDDTVFNSGWGYEDVALGLDAHFAGVDIVMKENPQVLHFVHNRTDHLHSHIQGRHRIMERYRRLTALKAQESLPIGRIDSLVLANGTVASTSKKEVVINGRVFTVPLSVRGVGDRVSLAYIFGKFYVNGWTLDTRTGEFSKSLLGKLIFAALSR